MSGVSVCGIWQWKCHFGPLSPAAIFGVSFFTYRAGKPTAQPTLLKAVAKPTVDNPLLLKLDVLHKNTNDESVAAPCGRKAGCDGQVRGQKQVAALVALVAEIQRRLNLATESRKARAAFGFVAVFAEGRLPPIS